MLLLLLPALNLWGLQVAYFICCRFLKTATFHPRVFQGTRMIYVSVPLTLALMVSASANWRRAC